MDPNSVWAQLAVKLDELCAGNGLEPATMPTVNPPLNELAVSSSSMKVRGLCVVVDRLLHTSCDDDALVLLKDHAGGQITCSMHAELVAKHPVVIQRGTALFLDQVSLVVVGPRCAFLVVVLENVINAFLSNHNAPPAPPRHVQLEQQHDVSSSTPQAQQQHHQHRVAADADDDFSFN